MCELGWRLERTVAATKYNFNGQISTTQTRKGECIPICDPQEYFEYSTLPRTSTMTCLPCNTGTPPTGFNMGDCLECTKPSECLRCNAKQLVNVPNRNSTECLDWCADRQYRDRDGICRNCADGCLSCSGGTFRDCTGLVCNQGFEKTSTSPSGNNISCMKICKDGEYRNNLDGNCLPCGHNCSKCTGGNPNNCISCKINFKL
mgnify:CR=1 FL=1